MQENVQIDPNKKDTYIAEVKRLKAKYKETKEKLTWIETTWEEEIIQNDMEKLATNIRALNRQIAEIESVEKKA